MIGLLAILSVVGLVLCIVLCIKSDCDIELCFGFGVVAAIGIIVFGIWSGGLLYKVNTAFTIGQEIEVYQVENAYIETEIDMVVKAYMQHEKDTFGVLKAESAITLATLFPDLKSDELVQQQIQLYIRNNKEIKALKIKEIGISKAKWLLYFGK